jgi:sec-independent protein translocase protein TatA
MGSFSIWHWLVVLTIVLVLFGRGRVSDIMGEFGKGIKSFKQGMDEGNKAAPRIEGPGHEAKSAEPAPSEPQPAPRSDQQG